MFPFFLLSLLCKQQRNDIRSDHQKYTLQRVGYTLLATFVAIIGMAVIMSIIYIFVFGSSRGMEHVILGVQKQAVFNFMMNFIWIPLKWLGISLGLLAGSCLVMIVPYFIFKGIYTEGYKAVRKKERGY